MNIAHNIDDTYRVCNPDQPLTADDERYVDLTESRGMHHIAKTITRNIRRSDESQVKLLFTGHRGSGKTTELFRLQKELLHEYRQLRICRKLNETSLDC